MPPDAPLDVHVLWHAPALASAEHARVQLRGPSLSAEGVAALPLGEVPCDVAYHLDVGPLAVRATVDVRTPGGHRHLELVAQGGSWSLDGAPAPELEGCTEVDLGWSPVTNSIPIRRLDLEVGASGTTRVAWLRFPELQVEVAEQRYERLDERRWRFSAGPDRFVLDVDPPTGLVRAYGEDLWRAVAWTEVAPGADLPAVGSAPAGPADWRP